MANTQEYQQYLRQLMTKEHVKKLNLLKNIVLGKSKFIKKPKKQLIDFIHNNVDMVDPAKRSKYRVKLNAKPKKVIQDLAWTLAYEGLDNYAEQNKSTITKENIKKVLGLGLAADLIKKNKTADLSRIETNLKLEFDDKKEILESLPFGVVQHKVEQTKNRKNFQSFTLIDICAQNKSDSSKLVSKEMFSDMDRLIDKFKQPLLEQLKLNQNMKINLQGSLPFMHPVSEEKFYSSFALPAVQTNNAKDLLNALDKFSEGLKDKMMATASYVVSIQAPVSITVNVYKTASYKVGSYVELSKTIQNKKCVVNIKNQDDNCLKYCVVYHLNKDKFQKKPSDIINWVNKRKEYNFLNGPVSLSDIDKIEEKVQININIFRYDEETETVYKFRISKNSIQENEISLLLIERKNQELFNKNNMIISHFCYITRLNVLLQKSAKQSNSHDSKRHFCLRCLHGFYEEKRLQKHYEDGCMGLTEESINVIPQESEKELLFENYKSKYPMPIVAYADFESLLLKEEYSIPQEKKVYQLKTEKHTPCSFHLIATNIYTNEILFNQSYTMQNEKEDIGLKFVEKSLEMQEVVKSYLQNNKRSIQLTKEDLLLIDKIDNPNEKLFCSFCEKSLNEKPKKKKTKKTEDTVTENEEEKVVIVCDHNHYCDGPNFRGLCHQSCNLNNKVDPETYKIPLFFHNAKNYDLHFIVAGLSKKNFSRIDVISENGEKFKTLGYANIQIKDSFMFLSESLDGLAKSVSLNKNKEDYPNLFPTLYAEFKDDTQMLLRKGVYPYEYMDSFEKFSDTSLPPIDKFYSNLSMSNISKDDYEYAKQVFKNFCKTMKDYHDLYLKIDTYLLCDIFNNFRKSIHNSHGLDAAYFMSTPALSWNCLLKCHYEDPNAEKLHLLTEEEMYEFCERGLRGGVCMISQRYAKANNEFCKDYDPEVEKSWLGYIDANNLYGYAMMQKLPMNNFHWLKFKENQTVYDIIKDNKDIGQIFEVDLHTPPELHDYFNCLPMAPENMIVTGDMLSNYQTKLAAKYKRKSNKIEKLVPHLGDKMKYVVHWRNLAYYLSKGMIVKKIHRVLQFTEKAWMKKYIEKNTELRKQADIKKDKFSVGLYKLMNNSVFGKTMEDVRKYSDSKFTQNEEKLLKLCSKPQFKYAKDLSYHNENHEEVALYFVEMRPSKVYLKKPIYTGLAILDLSKLHMYKAWYDHLKPEYGDNLKLCMTDTDSLLYHVKTENMYADMKEKFQDFFDLSNYKDSTLFKNLYNNQNQKIPGYFTEELGGESMMTEFVGLAPKLYAFRTTDFEKKVGKGISKNVLKKQYSFDMYKHSLTTQEVKYCEYRNIRSYNHQIYTVLNKKVGLTAYEDKRYLLQDGITSYAHGHKNISLIVNE